MLNGAHLPSAVGAGSLLGLPGCLPAIFGRHGKSCDGRDSLQVPPNSDTAPATVIEGVRVHLQACIQARSVRGWEADSACALSQPLRLVNRGKVPPVRFCPLVSPETDPGIGWVGLMADV